jgi:hypothetical protein
VYHRTFGSNVLHEPVSGRIIPLRDKYAGELVDYLLAPLWIIKKFRKSRAFIGRTETDQLSDCLFSFCPIHNLKEVSDNTGPNRMAHNIDRSGPGVFLPNILEKTLDDSAISGNEAPFIPV